MIKTLLDTIISTLFRSWFIDFDPVKAKVEGKSPYGMDEKIAALFPKSFEDSEIGPIPTGWKIGKLSDICDIKMGTSPKGNTYCRLGTGELPLLNGAGDFNGSMLEPKQDTTNPLTIANIDDFVFCIRATIGNLAICDQQYSIGRGVASAKEKMWFDKNFLYQLILHQFRIWEWEATGSVIKGVTGSDVRDSKIILPPEEIRELFENTVKYSMILAQKGENNKHIFSYE